MQTPLVCKPAWQDILAGTLVALILILSIRGYPGIIHDAVLYFGQALYKHDPSVLGQDFVFLHGSQADYTLFPWLLGHLVSIVAIPTLFMIGGLAGLLLFYWTSWICLRSLLPQTQRYTALLGVICLPNLYAMIPMFSYNEPFLTPRTFAQALCLTGIMFLSNRKLIPAVLAFLLAALLHPLQAIAAGLVAWIWLVMQDRRWLHALWLGIPVVALAIVGVHPFDGLIKVLDPAWYADVRGITGQLFLTEWSETDFLYLSIDVALLFLAWKTLPERFGGWCLASGIGVLIGFTASYILVDTLHLVLPAGLQLWRVHWIAHWLAIVAFAVLVHDNLVSRQISKALLLAFTATLAWYANTWLWIPFGALFLAWPAIAERGRFVATLGFLFAGGMAIMLAIFIADEMLPFRMAHYRLELYAIDRRILAFPPLIIALVAIALTAWARFSKRIGPAIPIALLSILACVAILRWDARSPIYSAIDNNAHHPNMFGVALPDNAQIYWDDDNLLATWMDLGRASYFNREQLAGIIFNRGTAMDAHARLDRILPLMRESFGCKDGSHPLHERGETCRVSEASLQRACAPGTPKGPDYLILSYRQRHRPIGQWNIMDPATGEVAISYYLYKCSDIAAASHGSAPGKT